MPSPPTINREQQSPLAPDPDSPSATVEFKGKLNGGRLVVIAGEPTGASVSFGESVTVGRAPDNDLVIHTHDVSRAHLRVSRQGVLGFVVEDLGSVNGTHLGPMRVVENDPQPLQVGDQITLGRHTRLVFLRMDPVEEQVATQQKMEALGRLAAGIAHDLNNLLLVMQVCHEVIGEELGQHELEEDIALSADDLARALERASGLTHQLLSFARKGRNERELFRLERLAEDTVALMRRTHPRVEVRLANELCFHVNADREQLHQVVMNLAINAAQAMDGRGVLELEVRQATNQERDRADLPEDGVCAALTVCDEGSGIPAQHLEHIFEPFFTSKAGSGGTGLGLATAYSIVRQHGGDMLVDSVEGQGTTFTVLLPQASAESETIRPLETRRRGRRSVREAMGSERALERLLVVDTQDLVLRSTRRLLRRTGLQVTGLLHGKEAIRLLRKDPEAFDAVVLDLHLVDMSGLEVLAVVQEVMPDKPVVITAGYLDDGERRKVLDMGASKLLFKPFSREDLLYALGYH